MSTAQRINPSTALPPGKMEALTSLRFFAAAFVVVWHTVLGLTHWKSKVGYAVVGMGFSVAVSFFFLLSGYILATVYMKSGKPFTRRRFYTARFARVYPLFFLTLVLDTPDLLWHRVALYGWHSALMKTTASFVASVLMLQAWFWRFRGIDFPNWSLSVETLFYAIFPFIAVALWRLRGTRLWLSMAGIYIIGQAMVLIVASHVNRTAVGSFPLLHVSTFALGILLARWQTLDEQGSLWRPAKPVVVYAVVAAATAAFATLFLFPQIPEWSKNDGLLAPIFCAYIWSFAQPGNLLTALFSARWLVLLGEASYGLYLIHIPFYTWWSISACSPHTMRLRSTSQRRSL